jgi:hypothetical protein
VIVFCALSRPSVAINVPVSGCSAAGALNVEVVLVTSVSPPLSGALEREWLLPTGEFSEASPAALDPRATRRMRVSRQRFGRLRKSPKIGR